MTIVVGIMRKTVGNKKMLRIKYQIDSYDSGQNGGEWYYLIGSANSIWHTWFTLKDKVYCVEVSDLEGNKVDCSKGLNYTHSCVSRF